MFTGLVESVGVLRKIQKTQAGLYIGIKHRLKAPRLKTGESIAVNGVCLTLVKKTPTMIYFDVARESLRVTTLGSLKEGSRVNLERALRFGDPVGGHLVSGHVDTLATLEQIKLYPQGAEWLLSFPKKFSRYVLLKGSVTLDGVSLTINKVGSYKKKGALSVFLIPHTLSQTNFHEHLRGDQVNLELDTFVKSIEKFVRSYENSQVPPIKF